jgi:hypothetical protein
MKKITLILSALVFSVAVMAQKADDVIKVNTETHNFGKIKQGLPVTYYFELTNTSDKPVVVESASASCGCTIPEKPTEPIMPGKTDKLKVVYSAAAVGPINKDVYIKLAGIAETKTVHITGEVLTAEAFDALPGKSKPQN